MRQSPQYPSPPVVNIFFFLVKNINTYSLNNFQICSTILSVIVTMLYNISPWLTHVCIFWPPSPILPILTSGNYQSGNFVCLLVGWVLFILFSSVQFSCSFVSDSMRPHGLQHARSPCPSPTPRTYSNSCLSSQWCHPTISSSVIPFSSCLQPFPASESFPMSQFFASRLSRVFSNTTVQKGINSLAHSYLYSQTLTSIHDYWKNHSFE